MVLSFGLNIGTTVNTTVNNYKTELVNTAGASATIPCKIKIGTIELNNVSGCVTSFENLCTSSASSALEATMNTVYNTVNTLSSEQRNDLGSFLDFSSNIQTTVNTVVTDIQNYMKNTCATYANVENSIEIMNFTLTNCRSSGQPLEFKFINSGHAEANCRINALMNLWAKATNEVETQQANTGFLNTFIQYGAYVAIFLGGLIVLRQITSLLKPDAFKRSRDNMSKKNITPWALSYDITRR
jgi:uncharacterized protein